MKIGEYVHWREPRYAASYAEARMVPCQGQVISWDSDYVVVLVSQHSVPTVVQIVRRDTLLENP